MPGVCRAGDKSNQRKKIDDGQTGDRGEAGCTEDARCQRLASGRCPRQADSDSRRRKERKRREAEGGEQNMPPFFQGIARLIPATYYIKTLRGSFCAASAW